MLSNLFSNLLSNRGAAVRAQNLDGRFEIDLAEISAVPPRPAVYDPDDGLTSKSARASEELAKECVPLFHRVTQRDVMAYTRLYPVDDLLPVPGGRKVYLNHREAIRVYRLGWALLLGIKSSYTPGYWHMPQDNLSLGWLLAKDGVLEEGSAEKEFVHRMWKEESVAWIREILNAVWRATRE